jgi:hypothetical protein
MDPWTRRTTLGYGYRSMPQEWKRDYLMEIEFLDMGCKLTLWSDDKYHFSEYTLTYEQLTEWKDSGCCPNDLAWSRSEFVRQILEDVQRADSMPHSGPRKWRSKFSLQHYNTEIHDVLGRFGQVI